MAKMWEAMPRCHFRSQRCCTFNILISCASCKCRYPYSCGLVLIRVGQYIMLQWLKVVFKTGGHLPIWIYR